MLQKEKPCINHNYINYNHNYFIIRICVFLFDKIYIILTKSFKNNIIIIFFFY